MSEEKTETALDLWRRWLEWSGNPYLVYNGRWEEECFFCLNTKEEGHEPDCVFVAAKKLAEEKHD